MFVLVRSGICALAGGLRAVCRRVSPYVRTVKTSSGATAVQIVYSSRRGSREIDHLGSAHSDAEVELLKAAARQRLAAGQGELDLGLRPDADGGGGLLLVTSSRMGHPWDALTRGYAVLGLEDAAGGDEVVVSDGLPAAAPVCPGLLAGRAVGGVRGACRAGPGQPGPLRREHLVFRDRCRRRVPGAGV